MEPSNGGKRSSFSVVIGNALRKGVVRQMVYRDLQTRSSSDRQGPSASVLISGFVRHATYRRGFKPVLSPILRVGVHPR